MNFLRFPFIASTILMVITTSCKSQDSDTTVNYPSVEKQRAAIAASKRTRAPRVLDSVQLVTDLRYFSSDACEGRAPGSLGHELAAQRIQQRMIAARLDSFGTLAKPFTATVVNNTTAGLNIIGYIRGTKKPKSFIVVSAHYDHMGKSDKGTFYGADDNASGAACLLAVAKYLKSQPHPYSIVFAAFDREERGLQGAYQFVKEFVGEQHHEVKLNINMDMIARSDKNELYACGINNSPQFSYLVTANRTKSTTDLLMGHDVGNSQENWTNQSDHYPFYKQKIPFLYFGVEDHADYHTVNDVFSHINLSRYVENCNLVAMIINSVR